MRVFAWLVLLCGGLFSASAPALPVDESPRISLLTFAPGETYWQRFGHNALLVEDLGRSRRTVYNYGMFDFQQENFFLNFARGHMRYRLDAQSLAVTVHQYAVEGRWIYQQELNLSLAQRRAFADALAANAQPENAEYRYDYFRDNCSTRVRDAIDRATGGALRAALHARPTATSYRFEATRLISPQPALMAGMDALLGPDGDTPLTLWQQSFVPEVFQQAVRDVRINGQPLVLREGWLLGDLRAPATPDAPLSFTAAALAGGLLLAALLGFAQHQRRHALARWSHAGLWLLLNLVCTLGGLVLLLAWTLTEHWSMWANRNLLLFSPLCALLLPAALASARASWQPQRRTRIVAVLIATAALASLVLLVLPGAQQQQPWVALLLPVHLAVAMGVARHKGAASG